MIASTDTFGRALEYAAWAHRAQRRKGSGVPYVAHLLAVTALVLEAGGTETEATAAVLHDVVEDQAFAHGGGLARLEDVRERFGDDVARIVRALSDWVSESGSQSKSKIDWETRKRRYHELLAQEDDPAVLLVSVADKLQNARSMEDDFEVLGDELWTRFSGTPAQIFWYYDELIAIYERAVPDHRRRRLVAQLAETIERLKRKSALAAS